MRVNESDYGEYDLKVSVMAHGGFIPSEVNVTVFIEPQGDSNMACERYVHDLKPARNKGFAWIGWWVVDEIALANKDGFDWTLDPENERFKYKCDIKSIVAWLTQFDDVELQESRNGYIVDRDFLLNIMPDQY
ncbi:Hoc-like head decoration [Pseudomonas phage PspYZU05]|uniref:Head outer capsid protein n=1 Tax=Pseudomonas phage PspYZU05 TaxID=1983556 RepID=A0A2U7N8C7_9CAUD|nr:Hoc-like head decoration [Pseudomonas phage PspYZU05]ASD52093.1 head outer capsid protein [Pseudomonas phage PspYZU05]